MTAAAARAIVQCLADEGLGEPGVDLHRDWLPANVLTGELDEVIAVMGIGGVPNYAMEGSAGVVQGQVQIQVRGKSTDYLAPEDRSTVIMHLLDKVDSYIPNPPGDQFAIEILSVTATQAPVLLERDEHERPVFITVYDVVYLPNVSD